MKKVYINSAVTISAQDTFESDRFLKSVKKLSGKTIVARYPNYKDYIATANLRRMAEGVKMGVTAASKALKDAKITQPDAIITGTGMGCIDDTEKFLNAIISNDEQFLTPTAFIQSTHNTVGAQIALGLQCKAYNNTYSHAALSFEWALMDAQLRLQQEEAENVLVGGYEELGKEIINYRRMMEDADGFGIQVPYSEGASFFVVSSEKTEHSVELIDMEAHSTLSTTSIQDSLKQFLAKNNVDISQIDVFVSGRNGDVFDSYYDLTAELFENITQLQYKHLSGEFYTASAFGLWTAYSMLSRQEIPEAMIFKGEIKFDNHIILIYNQFKGRDHSFILLKR
ncbi:beta-ketoacyl synthase chain length factor [Gelidibacter maritimus]|uniref:Beta-ketoacyl synthase chain length factor n=1 Tax=Gelidibacter maritimus TaxID=2761487 RepID=A0A7W2M700_9FLAO|nr:beta-ketoacyl synthase chain length factor [Gelidibacter maritimus]MBA6153892.1 beta-ketoacyl synthase chain length factor [Gelidibacter maritimus]